MKEHFDARRVFSESVDAFRNLVEMSGEFIALSGLDEGVLFINAAGRALIGVGPEADVTRFTTGDFLDAEGARRSALVERPAILRDGRWSGRSTLRHRVTGEAIPMFVTSYLLRDTDGTPIAVATVQRDERPELDARRITERRSAEERAIARMASIALGTALQTAFELVGSILREVLDTTSHGVVKAGTNEHEVLVHGRPSHVSRARTMPIGTASHVGFAAASGRSILSRDYRLETRFDPSIALSEGVRSGIASPIMIPDALWGVLIVHDDAANRFDEDDVAFVEAVAGILAQAVVRDITETALRHRALHDPLTDLPNRALIRDRLEHALAMRSSASDIVIALFDLNGFKHINDSFGHAAGDHVLVECARRLRAAAPARQTVGRLGGDEFVVICEGATAFSDATTVARAFLAALGTPIVDDEQRLFVGASIGIAAANGSLRTPSDLLRAADEAMYTAKRSRLDIVVHDAESAQPGNRRSRLVFALREALDAGAVTVAYQPIWDIATHRIVGVEALARWHDERFGTIHPVEFIPIAEESGMIASVGATVLAAAAASAVRARAICPDLLMHVNVSPRELVRGTYAGMVRETLAAAGLPPHALGLEITEAVLIEDLAVARAQLDDVLRSGVRISLDDFGTGFSSLSYLQRLPEISTIKIDKSFAAVVDVDQPNPVVLAIVTMAHALGKTVIAEGVETHGQAEALRALGCEYGQGYFVSEPLEEERLLAMLGAERCASA